MDHRMSVRRPLRHFMIVLTLVLLLELGGA
jgi:hypothetical protein